MNDLTPITNEIASRFYLKGFEALPLWRKNDIFDGITRTLRRHFSAYPNDPALDTARVLFGSINEGFDLPGTVDVEEQIGRLESVISRARIEATISDPVQRKLELSAFSAAEAQKSLHTIPHRPTEPHGKALMADAFTTASNIVKEFIDRSTGESGLWEVFPEWWGLDESSRARHTFELEKMVRNSILEMAAPVAAGSAVVLTVEKSLEIAERVFSFISHEYELELDALDELDRNETIFGMAAIIVRGMPATSEKHIYVGNQTPALPISAVIPGLKISPLPAGETHTHRTDFGGLSQERMEQAIVMKQLTEFIESLDDILQVKGEMSGAALAAIQHAREEFSKTILTTLADIRSANTSEPEPPVGKLMVATLKTMMDGEHRADEPSEAKWVNPYNFGYITPEWISSLAARLISMAEGSDVEFAEFHDLSRARTTSAVELKILHHIGKIIGSPEISVAGTFGQVFTPEQPYEWCQAVADDLFTVLMKGEMSQFPDMQESVKIDAWQLIAKELFAGLGGVEFFPQPETKNTPERNRREPWKMPISVARQIVDALAERADSDQDFLELFREWFDLPEEVAMDTIREELIGDILEIGRETIHANGAIGGVPLSFIYQNWRGEVGTRSVIPLQVYYAATEWHHERQWLLEALDTQKGELRSFALKDIIKIN